MRPTRCFFGAQCFLESWFELWNVQFLPASSLLFFLKENYFWRISPLSWIIKVPRKCFIFVYLSIYEIRIIFKLPFPSDNLEKYKRLPRLYRDPFFCLTIHRLIVYFLHTYTLQPYYVQSYIQSVFCGGSLSLLQPSLWSLFFIVTRHRWGGFFSQAVRLPCHPHDLANKISSTFPPPPQWSTVIIILPLPVYHFSTFFPRRKSRQFECYAVKYAQDDRG